MTDEKKEIEQALEAAAMELKAKGAAMDPEVAEAPESPAPEAEAEQTAEAKPEEKEAAEPEKPSEQKAKEKAKSKTAKPDDRKKSASALKELARVRRNKIIGITAAVIAVMVGIFLLARNDLKSNNHGGEPTVMEDGTKVYPDGAKELADGTVINPDGTTEQPDGTVISPDGTITQADGTVVTPPPVQPGDSNVSNVAADNGGAGGEADTPWSTMTDGDYQIAILETDYLDDSKFSLSGYGETLERYELVLMLDEVVGADESGDVGSGSYVASLEDLDGAAFADLDFAGPFSLETGDFDFGPDFEFVVLILGYSGVVCEITAVFVLKVDDRFVVPPGLFALNVRFNDYGSVDRRRGVLGVGHNAFAFFFGRGSFGCFFGFFGSLGLFRFIGAAAGGEREDESQRK